MEEFLRQTELSLEEILNLLKTGDEEYPDCMLANEIGIICCQGEDPDLKGEAYLLNLLSDEDENNRVIAACFLLGFIEGAKSRNELTLTEFRSNPKNASLLSFIDEAISQRD